MAHEEYESKTMQVRAAFGTTYYANPGDDLEAMANALQPGDTLILNDGTYYVTPTLNGLHMIDVHGTVASPITIKAAHDGAAIIDGDGVSQTVSPLLMTGCSYVIVQGLHVRNSCK